MMIAEEYILELLFQFYVEIDVFQNTLIEGFLSLFQFYREFEMRLYLSQEQSMSIST